jgi:hypothetical protein
LTDSNQEVYYQFLQPIGAAAPVPSSIVQWAGPIHSESQIKLDLGLYAQDQWTIKRLTISPGLRFDYFNGHTYPATLAAIRFLPARQYAEVPDVPNWRDISPRLGVAYDLFGTGKTAFKASMGRYVQSQGVGIAQSVNPALAIVTQTTRTWNDANRNFVPDCDLTVPTANGECGALANNAFGQPFVNTHFASDYLTGWGARPYTWQYTGQVQQELRPGMALNVAYFRVWYGNFTATQNQSVTASNFTQYCVTAPVDARLPGGGGNSICGLYDVNPTSFGRVNNLVSQAGDFGKQTQVFNGVDFNVNAKIGAKGLLAGGVSTGRTVTDNSYANTTPQVLAQGQVASTPRTTPFCHIVPPWSAATQIKLFGTYPLMWGIETSATLQNLAGIPDAANYVVTNALVAPSLGRNLAAGPNATATVALIPANSMFEDRLNQLDLRFTKVFEVKQMKAKGMLDLYNLLNASTVLAVNPTFGASWLRPAAILGARLVKFGVQVDF